MTNHDQELTRHRIDVIVEKLTDEQVDELYQIAHVIPLIGYLQGGQPALFKKAVELVGLENEDLLQNQTAIQQLERIWIKRLSGKRTVPRLWGKKRSKEEEAEIITRKDLANLRLLIVSSGNTNVPTGHAIGSTYKGEKKYSASLSFYKDGSTSDYAYLKVDSQRKTLAILEAQGDVSGLLISLEQGGFTPY